MSKKQFKELSAKELRSVTGGAGNGRGSQDKKAKTHGKAGQHGKGLGGGSRGTTTGGTTTV
jgi:bacteriocin-like protein